MGYPRESGPDRASMELAILPTKTAESKAWAAEMAAWSSSAAAESRTLRAEVENLQDRVRRLERTPKSETKSETGAPRKSVEVMGDFQMPRKTATAGRAANQHQGMQTSGSGSHSWTR